jgi:rfaE bifunctional protein nucleotidyltransferase chain/domain
MEFEKKILKTPQEIKKWRESLRQSGKKLVVTNGCFDLLHLGHVTYLQQARNLGDALLVGLNSDKSVSELKGPTRPVNSEHDRAAVLAALESVNGVCVFTGARCTELLRQVEPDIYCKGGDYTIESLNAEERGALQAMGSKIVILPVVPARSTTETLKKIARL